MDATVTTGMLEVALLGASDTAALTGDALFFAASASSFLFAATLFRSLCASSFERPRRLLRQSLSQ